MFTIMLYDKCEVELPLIYFVTREECVNFLKGYGFKANKNGVDTTVDEILNSGMMDSLYLKGQQDVELNIHEVTLSQMLTRDYNL